MTTDSALRELIKQKIELWRIGKDDYCPGGHSSLERRYNAGAKDQRLTCARALEDLLTTAPEGAQAVMPRGVQEALQRMIEDTFSRGPASVEDGRLVQKWAELIHKPEDAQAVGEVCVHDSYRYARLFNAEECALPEGTKLYTTPPSLNNEKTVPGFPGCTLERRRDYSILLRHGEEKLAQAYNRINHEYFLYQIFNAILDDEITRSTS